MFLCKHTIFARAPRAQMGDFLDPASLPSPPLPHRTPGIKPLPSANYARLRRPLHGGPRWVSSSTEGPGGCAGAEAVGATPRGVPTPDFI